LNIAQDRITCILVRCKVHCNIKGFEARKVNNLSQVESVQKQPTTKMYQNNEKKRESKEMGL
jgi:hypothetical protein